MRESIEPSEIITNGQTFSREKISRVDPQMRFVARFFDYSLLLGALLILRLILRNHYPYHLFEYFIPFEYFLWIPIEAILLSTWGETPGKALLGIRLTQGRKEKFSFQTAIKRSFNVWFRGFGLGIPLINVLCMLFAANRLRLSGSTSWDREENISVSHTLVSRFRFISAFIVALFLFLLYYGLK